MRFVHALACTHIVQIAQVQLGIYEQYAADSNVQEACCQC